MKRLLLVVAIACLQSACAVSSRYYLPTDAALARQQTSSCARTTHGYASLQLADQTSVVVTMKPVDNQIEIALQSKLAPGKSLRLVRPTIRMREAATSKTEYLLQLGPWESVVHGPGGTVIFRDYPDTNGRIQGKEPRANEQAAQSYAFNLFAARASVAAPAAKQYIITLPPMEVNSADTESALQNPFLSQLAQGWRN